MTATTTRLVALRTNGLSVAYGQTHILRDLDLDLPVGAELALMGRSGSGKTTLLLVLAGLLPPTAGSVEWPQLDDHRQLRRHQVGLVFQAPSLLPELTAAENVALPLRLRGSTAAAARDAAATALAALDISGVAGALPVELSGGQQQRVAVARVLAGQHRLILADEPTGALDRDSAATVLQALREHAHRSGATLIVATHDAALAALLPDRAELSQGQLTLTLSAGRR